MPLRNPNVRGRQVVRFSTNGKRFAQQFGLPAFVRGVVARYDAAKVQAVADVSAQAAAIATEMVLDKYTVPAGELAGRLRTANTPDTFRLFASSLRLPLSLFRGAWGGPQSAGATAEIVKGAVKTYAHAFIEPGRYRGRVIPMIYTRIGGKVRMRHGRYAGRVREPIRALRGPSTYQMITGTDQGGEKWVPLRALLTDRLRALYLAAVQRRYAESSVNE